MLEQKKLAEAKAAEKEKVEKEKAAAEAEKDRLLDRAESILDLILQKLNTGDPSRVYIYGNRIDNMWSQLKDAREKSGRVLPTS